MLVGGTEVSVGATEVDGGAEVPVGPGSGVSVGPAKVGIGGGGPGGGGGGGSSSSPPEPPPREITDIGKVVGVVVTSGN